IQTHYLLSTARPNQAWFTFGTVAQLTLALGLHQKRPKHRDLSPLSRELRRRIFWSVYTSDRYISVALGRPTLLQEEYITQDLPQSVNDEDLTTTTSNLHSEVDCLMDAAILQAKLARIVSKSLHEQYTSNTTFVIERLMEHNQALDDWRAQLPPFLSGVVKPS